MLPLNSPTESNLSTIVSRFSFDILAKPTKNETDPTDKEITYYRSHIQLIFTTFSHRTNSESLIFSWCCTWWPLCTLYWPNPAGFDAEFETFVPADPELPFVSTSWILSPTSDAKAVSLPWQNKFLNYFIILASLEVYNLRKMSKIK